MERNAKEQGSIQKADIKGKMKKKTREEGG
jgi:hypothetical protein